MNHMSYDTWLRYVNDELSEQDRQRCEDHLYTCDECLRRYLQAMEHIEESIPPLSNHLFTDHVMEKVERKSVERSSDQSLFRSKLMHYAIATAMTIMLMGTGVFSQLIETVGQMDSDHYEESSLITNFLNSSLSIVDELKNKPKGDQHE